jgi:predicted Co/Zn/Cd cation transporter (cation efflux family)
MKIPLAKAPSRPARPGPSARAVIGQAPKIPVVTASAFGLWPIGREFLMLTEFAKLLQVTVQHAQNLVDRHQLQTVEKLRPARRHFRVSRAGFERFIAARTIGNPKPGTGKVSR